MLVKTPVNSLLRDPAMSVNLAVYSATLDKVNEFRRVAHLPELLRMPHGSSMSVSCPLARALSECGVIRVSSRHITVHESSSIDQYVRTLVTGKDVVIVGGIIWSHDIINAGIFSRFVNQFDIVYIDQMY